MGVPVLGSIHTFEQLTLAGSPEEEAKPQHYGQFSCELTARITETDTFLESHHSNTVLV